MSDGGQVGFQCLPLGSMRPRVRIHPLPRRALISRKYLGSVGAVRKVAEGKGRNCQGSEHPESSGVAVLRHRWQASTEGRHAGVCRDEPAVATIGGEVVNGGS
jgi:hypothetical protein